MNIKLIKLKSSGFKGMEVHYFEQEEKNGRPSTVLIKKFPPTPIHLGLETMFKDLRFYLVDITGLLRGDEDKMTKDYTIQETEVVSIDFDSESFTIGGEKQVFSNKTIKLKTCKVDTNDLYEHFDTVQKLIGSIVEETKEYLAGTKKVDDIEVAVRWIQAGKSKDLTEDSIKGWSPEQLKEFATKLLENQFGAVVMHNEDMDVSNVDVSAANLEIAAAQAEETIIEEAVIIEDDYIEIAVSDEESFIPVPVKKSKAEKKEIAAKIIGDIAVNLNERKYAIPVVETVIKPAF